MTDYTREGSTIRKDILDALARIFPHDVVELYPDEESYFDGVYEELREKLSDIDFASVEYERHLSGLGIQHYCLEASPFRYYLAGNNDREDILESEGLDSSYHLFFIALTDERFRLQCMKEYNAPGDEDNLVQVKGTATTGFCVAISLLAPFSLVVPGFREVYEDGSYSYPDILNYCPRSSRGPMDICNSITRQYGEDVRRALMRLKRRILRTLDSLGISILPDREAAKPVTWLNSAENVFSLVRFDDEIFTLKDVLFHRGIY